MVAVPLLVLLVSKGTMCFGGASAPIDPFWAARHPKKAALMSAAGPLANVMLAAIAFTVLYFVGHPRDSQTAGAVFDIAHTFFWLNLLLAIFNLIPLPPFDGSGVVGGLFPKSQRFYDSFQRMPMSIVIAMLTAWFLLDYTFVPVYYEVGGWLPVEPWMVRRN
jgi:Zn-dependent protease